ncbi:thiamine biosynthesis enzyme [Myxozyma melibiosi]|uniref:Thiamine biosynthesis enzyme n=1 Tax=Myxozyma melibiosi TaxID=54550 RepID=A0ABR1F6N5_9ASCO
MLGSSFQRTLIGGARAFSTSRSVFALPSLKVGYVPEHFSTPMFFAKQQNYYEDAGVDPEFIPYKSGTGHMIEALKNRDIDLAVGLTEGFVAGLGKGQDWFQIVGNYVKSPLCWAISTGINRDDVTAQSDIRGGKIGISRIGSGSYVMPFVLARQEGWKEPFEFKILNDFKNLRDGVNNKTADAFMWELFTSKRYYDIKEIKYVGRIYTPWPSWVVTAHTDVIYSEPETAAIARFFSAVNKGITYFNQHPEEAVEYIAANLDYTKEDAQEWLHTVEFSENVAVVDQTAIIDNTVEILKSAGVIEKEDIVPENFVYRVKSL